MPESCLATGTGGGQGPVGPRKCEGASSSRLSSVPVQDLTNSWAISRGTMTCPPCAPLWQYLAALHGSLGVSLPARDVLVLVLVLALVIGRVVVRVLVLVLVLVDWTGACLLHAAAEHASAGITAHLHACGAAVHAALCKPPMKDMHGGCTAVACKRATCSPGCQSSRPSRW